MVGADLVQSVLDTEDPVILHSMALLLQAWSQGRTDLPEDFSERFTVTGVRRQPITGVVLTRQLVFRELVPVEHPYAGGSVASHRWPTRDLFELVGLNRLEFPPQQVQRTLAVDGEEEVLDCGDCQGDGRQSCPECSGAGTSQCPACGGSRKAACPQCDGEGAVVKPNGNITACPGCQGTGSLRCPRCEGKGRVHCVRCRGEGKLQCGRCQGHGRLKRAWIIDERAWSDRNWACFAPEAWALPMELLVEESLPVASAQWPVTAKTSIDESWKGSLPPEIQQAAQRLLDECQHEAAALDSGKKQMTGVRLEVRGCYAYELGLNFRGNAGDAYLAGSRGRVVPNGLPRSPGLWRRWLEWLLRNFWNEVDVDVRPRLAARFLSDLREGRVHVWDVRGLLPLVAQELDISASLTGEGYRLILPVAGAGGASHDVAADIRLETDETETLVLCAECWLSEAHRDRYPTALTLNQKLEFGRIAVIDEPFTGKKFFWLVDRRPYEFADPAGYADVLVSMAYDAAAVISRRTLG